MKSEIVKNKKRIAILIFTGLVLGLSLVLTYAAFIDKGKVLGSSFSVASSDLKLLINPEFGIDPSNLSDEIEGPNFTRITPNWSENYLIKVFNNGTENVTLSSNADYLTINDPDDLRNIIFVEPFAWNDVNSNGQYDSGEEGASLGRKTIVKWKTEGYLFGTLTSGELKGWILRFSTDSVSDTKMGKSAIFDFIFDAISE